MRDLLHLGSCIFDVYTSPCGGRATGGVVTLVRKELGASFDFSQAQSIVPGRVQLVSLRSDGCELAFYGQFSNYHVCFCGLGSGNLRFETARTNKQHICF